MGVVLVIPAGRMANRMIQRIAAESIKNQLDLSRVVSPPFPDWEKSVSLGYRLLKQKFQIQSRLLPKSIETVSGNSFTHDSRKLSNVMLVGNMLNIDILNKSRMLAREYFPASKTCSCCNLRAPIDYKKFNVIHVRLGDIWDSNPKTSVSYFPLDFEFYQSVAKKSPKPFAILAQADTAEKNEYINRIKSIQPGSTIIQSGCALSDFQLLRKAETLTLSTSTYSWLAYWLSEKNEKVFVPNAGLFNRETRPDINLIQTHADETYEILSASRYLRKQSSRE